MHTQMARCVAEGLSEEDTELFLLESERQTGDEKGKRSERIRKRAGETRPPQPGPHKKEALCLEHSVETGD